MGIEGGIGIMKSIGSRYLAKGAVVALALMFSLLFGAPANAASFAPLRGYGVDTIAGYSTLLSTSKTFPGQAVVFKVVKPDSGVVRVDAITGSDGVAKIDLYDYHTRKAGIYEVSAFLIDSSDSEIQGGPASTFEVYPDTVSQVTSLISVDKNVAKADGKDKVYLSVALRDKYGNPFSGHVVNLISSRASDEAVSLSSSSLTDFNGVVNFSVTSFESGVSVFSAVDATSGVVLDSRAKVAFLSSDDFKDQIGGFFDSFIPVASAQGAGSLAGFEIFGLPAPVIKNQNINFTVRAVDQNNLTVENYTGSVHFSAEGANSNYVTLPEDYTFKADDLGVHEFSLGLKFTADGTYTIVATDINNTLVTGEKSVTVGAGVSTGSVTLDELPPPVGSPVLISPVNGTYSQRTQSITGTAPPGSVIKIFDNSSEIGSVQTNLDGNFSFITAPLIDGRHSIYVSSFDNADNMLASSGAVDIVIDNTAPLVDEVIVDPSGGVASDEVFNVTVLCEPNLSQAAIIFADDIYEMSPVTNQPGAYTAQLRAPATMGDYAIDVLVADELGNEKTYFGVANVYVSGGAVETGGEDTGVTGGEGVEGGETTTGDSSTPGDTGIATAGNPPSQVFGVIAYGSNKRVTLVWEGATDDSKVSRYKIYYGLDPVDLNMSVVTFDSSTTWYIPELENGSDYYFSVVAIDDGGQESVQRSEIVNAIPFTLEVESTLPDRPDESLADLGPDGEVLLRGASLEGDFPLETVDNGPGLLWLLFGAGGVGEFVRRRRGVR